MYHRVLITGLCLLALVWPAAAQLDVKQMTFSPKRDEDPVVSPDGRHLAFASNRTGKFNIYMMTFGEAGTVQLTQSKKDDRRPSWSRNSKTILFNSKRTGNGDLYEMAYDGTSGFLQLSDRADIDEYASYDPKGSGILFMSAPKKIVRVRDQFQVVTAAEKARANNARPLGPGTGPRYAPDGNKIVFVSRRTKNNDIWMMNRDGGMQTQLTTDPKDDEDPCFSPNGKQIIFASKRTGNYDLWVMDLDGTNQRQLTGDPADETSPCWSSGGYIYYAKRLSQTQSNIFRIKAP